MAGAESSVEKHKEKRKKDGLHITELLYSNNLSQGSDVVHCHLSLMKSGYIQKVISSVH